MVLTCKVQAGFAGAFLQDAVAGVLMSFLDALRSQAEQVALGARLIIDSSVLR
ncbi:hypothetical protein HK44_009270 [Pseudomonas fluorescens HK44]|uniref:Uncharacterized protein n=1 Tax=Pseudomonas fluorescens HK44 TaxID=1042209 RepID=A0A010RZL1_PSEFL|nr:hypothetical protein HK44_009270 [Pseudomonas fluorescens HK44]